MINRCRIAFVPCCEKSIVRVVDEFVFSTAMLPESVLSITKKVRRPGFETSFQAPSVPMILKRVKRSPFFCTHTTSFKFVMKLHACAYCSLFLRFSVCCEVQRIDPEEIFCPHATKLSIEQITSKIFFMMLRFSCSCRSCCN